MKKFNTILAIAAVAVSSVFGLTSCDKDNEPFNDVPVVTPQEQEAEKPHYEESEQEKQLKIPVVFTSTSEVVLADDAPADAGEQLAQLVNNYISHPLLYATVDSKWENGSLSLQLTSNEYRVTSTETQLAYYERVQFDLNRYIQGLGFVKNFTLDIQGVNQSFHFVYRPAIKYMGTWEYTDAEGTKYELTFDKTLIDGSNCYTGHLKVNGIAYNVTNINDVIVCGIDNYESGHILSYHIDPSKTDYSNDHFAATITSSNKTEDAQAVFHRVK